MVVYVNLKNSDKVVLISSEDAELVSQYTWSLHNKGYACTYIKGKPLLMHRLILGAQREKHVDHKNHDTLDNSRGNLRLCSRSENMWNLKRNKRNTSGYKGVIHANSKWVARIKSNGKNLNLGRFTTAEEAAYHYDKAAVALRGEFVLTNGVYS